MKTWGYITFLMSLVGIIGRAQTSAQQLAERLDTVPSTAHDYFYKALSFIKQHDYEQATTWLERMAAIYPKEQGQIGELYLSRLHNYSCALHYLDAYDALTPTFNDMVGNNPVSYLRGLVYRNLGDHCKAIEEFSIGIDRLEARHGAEWVNYRHFVSRAVSYLAVEQPEKALIDLDKASKIFKRSALIPYYRALALLQLCRLPEALTALQDASFFYKALRYERAGEYWEDDYNPLNEAGIENMLTQLKSQVR
jgi:tetratricopeptide (TPR) repeat protein